MYGIVKIGRGSGGRPLRKEDGTNMPGFMGIRGLEPQNPHDRERERREEQRSAAQANLERRSQDKVQEILREQEGDMSAYNGKFDDRVMSDCDKIAGYKVESIMSAKVAALSFDDNLLTVQGIFSSVKFRHLPVVDEAGNIIGIISDRDFLRTVSPFFGTVNEQNRDRELMGRRVGTIMTRKPICADRDATIMEAVRTMNSRKISCLPIVEPGTTRLLGIVTWKDVVRAFCPAAFSSSSESSRLKSGVTVNPPSAESARLRAKSAESARLRTRSGEPSRQGTVTSVPSHPAKPHEHNRESDTRRLSLKAPQVGQQEKLHPSAAGRAGSRLASAQQELMREELSEEGHHSPTDSARMRAPDPEDDKSVD